MSFAALMIFTLFSTQSFGNPLKLKANFGSYGELIVTKWADDRQSAFTFSFDDGFISHYQHVRDILNQFDFKATFYVMPPFLTEPPIWRYGTWPMFEMISEEGHEIGSHTLNHPYLTQLPVGDTSTPNTVMYELYHSKRMIEERITDRKCITFAYPYGDHNNLIDSLTGLFYESARGLGGQPNHWSLTPMDWMRLKSYEVHFDEPRNSLLDDLDELFEFIDWLEISIADEKWGIQLAHEVVPFSEINNLLSQGSRHPISNEWLELLCNWFKQKYDENKIWIETAANVTKYIKQRDSYSYQVIAQSSDEIKIELTDSLDDEIFDYPLSAYIYIPDEWKDVLLEQGNRAEVLKSFFIDTLNFILAKVIPDGGVIRLTKFEPNFVADNDVKINEFELFQNYPNPFNPLTTISWQSSVSSQPDGKAVWQTLRIYDILGNEVATLVDEEIHQGRTAGVYKIIFDGSNLASGVYIYQLRAGNTVISKKMNLLK